MIAHTGVRTAKLILNEQAPSRPLLTGERRVNDLSNAATMINNTGPFDYIPLFGHVITVVTAPFVKEPVLPPAARTSSPLAVADVELILDQLECDHDVVAVRSNRVRLEVSPTNLGRLNIEIECAGLAINISITSLSERSHTLITAATPGLTRALQAGGLAASPRVASRFGNGQSRSSKNTAAKQPRNGS